MTQEDWQFPDNLQPNPSDTAFDLSSCLNAVVCLKAEIPDDAFTADTLGTSRQGNGIVINKTGLIATIGYLITEAETIWLTSNSGRTVPGTVMAYDQASGFGLVQALGSLDIEPIKMGTAEGLSSGDGLFVISHGGIQRSLIANLLAKHCFAGYWEYFLEEAIFSCPVHPQWGGAAILDKYGELVAIGSLLTEEATAEGAVQANMSVPIDLIKPILSIVEDGVPDLRVPRPWLGMYATDNNRQVIVVGLADRGPAQEAGIRPKDIVLAVNEISVSSLADFLKTMWADNRAGDLIKIQINRDDKIMDLKVKSANRDSFLKKPLSH